MRFKEHINESSDAVQVAASLMQVWNKFSKINIEDLNSREIKSIRGFAELITDKIKG